MSIIPDDKVQANGQLNLAPMVDFLFLVVAVFATLAVTRAVLYDSEVELVKVQPATESSPSTTQHEHYIVNLSVNDKGQYKWITEFNEYLIQDVLTIQQELHKQQTLGLIPKDNAQTKVLLHIDKSAQWEPIAQVIFAVRQAGFEIRPVYDLDESML